MLEGQAITQLPDSVEHMKELPRMAHPEEEALLEADRESEASEDLDKLEHELEQPVTAGAEPMVERDGKLIPFRQLVKADVERRPKRFYAAKISVRDVNYTVQVPEMDYITTIASLFKPKKVEKLEKSILKNISFTLLPYESTALLGGPRSGKTSLFDIIAQRSRTGKITGTVSVNGHIASHYNGAGKNAMDGTGAVPTKQKTSASSYASSCPSYHRIVSYVQQGDVHSPLLTVRETLLFAARCQFPENDAERIHARVDVVLQILGLTHAANTLVGDEALRGISGGERRRLSIGVEWVKGPKLLLLDEPTTGLDSGAAMNIGRLLRIISRRGSPVLCALLQPSWQLLQTFDKLIILSRGQIAFWGPVSEAIDYFAKLGFPCPPNYNASEFLSEVVDRPDKFPPLDVEQSADPNRPKSTEDFLRIWQQSDLKQRMEARAKRIKIGREEEEDQLAPILLNGNGGSISPPLSTTAVIPTPPILLSSSPTPPPQQQQPVALLPQTNINVPNDEEKKMEKKKKKKPPFRKSSSKVEGDVFKSRYLLDQPDWSDPYPRNRLQQFSYLVWRGWLMYTRDYRREILNMIGVVIIAVFLGLFFLDMNNTLAESAAKLGLLYFTIARVGFNALGTIPLLYMDRPVFYRQRAAKYYAVLPYSASSIVLSLPYTLVEVGIFGSIVYWMSGLAREADKFFFFLLVLFVISLLFSAFARMIASLMPAPILASILTSTILAVFLLFSGFLISKPRAPDPWVWMFYISPFFYAINALSINEMSGRTLRCSQRDLQGASVCPITTGEQFLSARNLWLHTWQMCCSRRVAFIALFLFMCLYMVLYYLALRFVNFANLRRAAGTDPDIKEKLHPELSQVTTNQTQKCTLSWRNLIYTVPTQNGDRVLLNEINGFVRPGMLLALMGSSGAGKTTLLDVLAMRKNVGKIEGTISVNGKVQKMGSGSYARLIGYVEQTDVHWPHNTVLEALHFAAESRLPSSYTKEQRTAVVERVLDLLEMRPLAGMLVGWGGPAGGINPEERKRLSIGIQLVAQPAILFLDEPTSGLDSAGAERVMAAIAHIAQDGTSVICTIHQPSSRVFARASDLLLLSQLGEVVYFGEIGENSTSVMKYFEEVVGVKSAPGTNPADFVLEVSLKKLPGSEHSLEAWQSSEHAKRLSEQVAQMSEGVTTIDSENPIPGMGRNGRGRSRGDVMMSPVGVVEDSKEKPKRRKVFGLFSKSKEKSYAISWWRQFLLQLQRWSLAVWRSPQDLIINLIRSLILGLIFGTAFWMRPLDQKGAQERIGVLFFSAIAANLMAFSFMTRIYYFRSLFYRERANRFYHSSVFVLGQVLVDIPVLALNMLVFGSCFYWLSGLQRDAGRFFFFLLCLLVLSMLSTVFAQSLAATFARPDSAGLILSSTMAVFAIGAGFLIPRPLMGGYVVWVYWVSFARNYVESVATNEFRNLRFTCGNSSAVTPAGSGCAILTGERFLHSYGMVFQRKWPDLAALFGYYLLFLVWMLIAFRFIKHIKR